MAKKSSGNEEMTVECAMIKKAPVVIEQCKMNLRLVSVQDFCASNPIFNINTVRKFIFKNHKEFRSRCVCTIGRRVFINVDAVEEWLLNSESLPPVEQPSLSPQRKKSKTRIP